MKGASFFGEVSFILSSALLGIVARTLRCPRDGKEALLESVQGRKGQFQLDVCSKCGGAWFDKGEITKISGNREIERMIVEYAGGPSGLACPRCGRVMDKRPVGDFTLDVCGDCEGVWIDKGELDTAVRALSVEFSDVFNVETAGLARTVIKVNGVFSSSRALEMLHHPQLKRRYPPDVL